MRDIKFGMKRNQPPPHFCRDCGALMSKPIYSHMSFRVECTDNCGCYYQWQDPWTQHHHLPLFELALKQQRSLQINDTRASSR